MSSPRPRNVALVGRRLPHNENLGLAYLASALKEADIGVERYYVHDEPSLRRALEALTARPPDLLGLSLSDGGSALWPLALAEALSARGVRPHVTAGGQFATLARAWLLERYAFLDSVVRFAGEVPLVALARRLAAGGTAQGVPGVTTREGDGAPAPVLSEVPMRLRPDRDELPHVLGLPACHIAASRGCAGRCHYCGPAALHTLERSEGRRSGASLAALDACGVGGLKSRRIDEVSDEIAELWHDRGVRYFYFVDEHLLPYREAEALELLARWKRGLAERRVGALGIGAMLRADRVTPRVADAFAEVGLVRCFVGLELGGPEEARGFGRKAPSAADLALIGHLAGAGVATVSNLMLLHPYSTPGTIRGALELLERLPGGVFEATRMMVYHGTRLEERVRSEGRLRGNPFRHAYTFESPVMERFSSIFTRLRGEAFQDYSIAYRAHDAHLSLALAQRIDRGRVRRGAEATLEHARRGTNALYVEAYRRAIALAEEGCAFDEAGALVEEMFRRARALEAELDEVDALLSTGPGHGATVHRPMRAAAAGALSFVMLGSAGCYASHQRDGAPVDGGRRDAASADTAALVCTDAARARDGERAVALAREANECFTGYVELPPRALDATFQLHEWAGDLSYVPCRDGSDPSLEMERDVERALAGSVPACATGTVAVRGGAAEDARRMGETVSAAACAMPFADTLRIVVGEDGRVARVVSASGSAEIEACIRAALSGLTFPCLSNFEICPEFAIAE